MRKHILLAGTAVIAVGLAAPAQAFDKANWTWDLDINQRITSDWDIDADLDPSGLVVLQDLQIHVGNVTSTSTVSGIENQRELEGEVEGSLSFRFEGEVFDNGTQPGEDGSGTASYEESATGDLAGIVEGEIPTETVFGTFGSETSATGIDGGVVNGEAVDTSGVTVIGGTSSNLNNGDPNSSGNGENGEVAGIIFDVSIDASAIDWEALGFTNTLDARTELPEIESQATAVANNVTIESNVATQVHESQFAFGDFNGGRNGLDQEVMDTFTAYYGSDAPGEGGDGNLGVAGALAMMVAGFEGDLMSGDVTARSNVSDILNASVDSDATAVVNNKSVSVDARTGDDRVVVADVTQVGYMDSTASSNVRDVTVQQYSNLGRIDPVVSSVSTAVGNNLSINVE